MIAPEGYRPFSELVQLAHKAAEKEENKTLGDKLKAIPHPEDSIEHYSEAREILNGAYNSFVVLKTRMIHNFLRELPRIFLSSPQGIVLEVSKHLIVPFDVYMPELDKNSADNFYTNLECIDDTLWVIDCEKLDNSRTRFRDFAEEMKDNENFDYSEHPRFVEMMHRYDGWSLCVREIDFPKNEDALSQKPRDNALSEQMVSGAVDRILQATQTDGVTKSNVRQLFPHFSARQFEHYWRLAAQKKPEIAKPGRKS